MAFEKSFDITKFIAQSSQAEIAAEAAYFRSSPNLIPLPGGCFLVRNSRGWCCVGLIFSLWLYHSLIIPGVVLLPLWTDGYLKSFPVWAFYFLSASTCFCLIRSALSDPGRVPFESRSTSAAKINWTHCQRCLVERPIKSHHCSKCQRCIRKMDHHCHWINNCVGEDNQWIFMLLVTYGTLLSIYSLLLIALYFYVFPPCISCSKEYFIHEHAQYLMYIAFVTGVGLLLICSSQVAVQFLNTLLNRTTVENIINKHKLQNSVNLSHNNAYSRFQAVCGGGPIWCWLNPYRRRRWRAAVHYQKDIQYI